MSDISAKYGVQPKGGTPWEGESAPVGCAGAAECGRAGLLNGVPTECLVGVGT